MQFVMHEVLKVTDDLKAMPAMPTSTPTPSTPCWKRPASSPPRWRFRSTSAATTEGCKLDTATHAVTTPKGFKEAYAQYVEGGWPA
jgi:hypothetical protein